MSPFTSSLRILAFEPFDAGSHRAVRESISRHAQHEWTWITRPGRNWKWRMRLAAVEMVDQAMGEGLLQQAWDAIFCTSLMSAADLRSLLPPRLRSVPVVLYMHENQAAYPAGFARREAGDRDFHFALTNLTGVLAADRVIWNSAWNKRSFISGIESILTHADDAHIEPVAHRIGAKSVVVWPPVETPALHPTSAPDDGRETETGATPYAATGGVLHNSARPVRVVWPHRWEHDKGPDELLAVAERWSEECNLRWTILGERYRETPQALIEFESRFQGRIDHVGYLPDRAAYWAALHRCDWVLSTARHEFFGIAVVEALLTGCLPWLPERLSYPELLPQTALNLGPMHPPADPVAVRAAVRAHLKPALAPNAVVRIEQEIEQLVMQDPA